MNKIYFFAFIKNITILLNKNFHEEKLNYLKNPFQKSQ
jgi:hypothetical protein